MKIFQGMLTALAVLVLAAAPAAAQVPQTIVLDGTNDFNPANLIDADGGDTQYTSLDLGDIYVTNDNSFLYFGFEYDRDGWCDINLGIAIDVNGTPAGGIADAFGRKIAWNTIANKPDFYLYDVVPTQCSSYNYEVLYSWNGAAWTTVLDGPDGLGIVDGLFTEGKISLASLGVSAGDVLNIEFWVTQEGSTKGPLDASCSDAVQLSTPGGTTFDTPTAIEMTCYNAYTVQSLVDVTPPTVLSTRALGFAVDGQQQIALSTTQVDVKFSEPVGAGANVPGNYAISNTAATVASAVVDGSDASLVHLTLTAPITYSANFYDVTVTGVQDLAGNPIVNNGTSNVRSFFLKKLRFEGDMSVFMLTNSAPPDSFHVEGSLSPLTFTTKDNARGIDVGAVDSLFVTSVPLSVSKSTVTGKAEVTLEWKWHHQVAGYEPRSNRQHLVSSDNGDCDTLRVFWNDDDPTQVTNKEIDVIFRVDANNFGPLVIPIVTVTGDQSPLPNFAIPGIEIFDDGNFPDDVANDGIFAGTVRFPVGTYKTVQYKFTFNDQSTGFQDVYECFNQGNREVFLNDALFDIVGGPNGPIDLPARAIDRCSVTDKDIAVIFRVDADYWFGGAVTSVGVNGSVAPLNFNVPSETPMVDNGVAPDAGIDNTYTVQVVFPDSTDRNVGYKYLINDTYECVGFPDRSLFLDDVVYSLGNPLIPPVGIFGYCQDITTGTGDLPRPQITIHLAQNYPNPFSGKATTIEFQAERSGRARLEVFDVAGRLVGTPLDRDVNEGLHRVQWNPVDRSGRDLAPGIYFYTLSFEGQKTTRRMVLTAR